MGLNISFKYQRCTHRRDSHSGRVRISCCCHLSREIADLCSATQRKALLHLYTNISMQRCSLGATSCERHALATSTATAAAAISRWGLLPRLALVATDTAHRATPLSCCTSANVAGGVLQPTYAIRHCLVPAHMVHVLSGAGATA